MSRFVCVSHEKEKKFRTVAEIQKTGHEDHEIYELNLLGERQRFFVSKKV